MYISIIIMIIQGKFSSYLIVTELLFSIPGGHRSTSQFKGLKIELRINTQDNKYGYKYEHIYT
jgi:hypothetical protein